MHRIAMLAVAVAVVALVAPVMGANPTCATLSQFLPNASAYTDYVVPSACSTAYSAIADCETNFNTCFANVNAENCSVAVDCLTTRRQCLELTPIYNASACDSWSETLKSLVTYIQVGGQYQDSALQRSCYYSACQWAGNVVQNVNGTNATCDIDLTTVCEAPVELTAAPTASTYQFSLDGNWTDILANETQKTRVTELVQEAVAEICNLNLYNIKIVDLALGSLIVRFQTVGASLTDAQIQAALLAAQATPGNVWAALSSYTGLTISIIAGSIVVTAATPAPTTTPSPETGDRDPSCGGDCKLIIILLCIFVPTIICMILSVVCGRRKKAKKNEPEEV